MLNAGGILSYKPKISIQSKLALALRGGGDKIQEIPGWMIAKDQNWTISV